MNRPIVIVDPLSSGVELALTFKQRGIPAVAVTWDKPDWKGFGSQIHADDFIEVMTDQPGLVDKLKAYNPLGVIPGTEEAVPLAEKLSLALTPQLANDASKSKHRLHKALMQQALAEAGVPVLKTLNATSEQEAEGWIEQNELQAVPLIIKPPISAGSDKVFHIDAGGDWRMAFRRVLNEPSQLTAKDNESVVVQEQAIGAEFAVGTVSANGQHALTHLIHYHKSSVENRKTVFDYVEFIPYSEEAHSELFAYVERALDALGIRWGAAHTEVMLTANGPRLIEVGARMVGGPTVGCVRAATGSSQADRLADVYSGVDKLPARYAFKQFVMSVFLRSPSKGVVLNAECFEAVANLPTLLNHYLWFETGASVPMTVDYLSSIGIVVLAGDREMMLQDYQKIRYMESHLRIAPEVST